METQAGEADRFVRCRAASQSMSTIWLMLYANDHDEAVRAALLTNSVFASEADTLAQRELQSGAMTWVMRQAIAHSPYVSSVTLRQVAAGGELYVQLGLVNNPRCPTDVLERFVHERQFEHYTEEKDDNLRRVYKSLFLIAQERLRAFSHTQ